MTANQIAYAQLGETKRHNIVSESQNQRDVASRELTAAASYWQAQTASARQKEEGRHNLASEELEASKLSENQRHNRETERVNWYSAQNTADWQAAQSSATMRQAAAAEAQATAATLRAATDSQRLEIERTNADTNRISALAASLQASTAASIAKTREKELELSQQRAQEEARHNSASESIAWANASEIARSNKADEYVNRIRAAETQRSNLASESLAASQHMETVRHNMTSEGIAVSEAANRKRSIDLQEQQQRFDRNIKSVETGLNVASRVSSLAMSILGGLP